MIASVITHWLFLFLLLLSLYDLRTGKIPNWTTLPLLALGIILHFPGDALLWLGCGLLFAAWRSGQMGAGDAKLWIALFWLMPTDERFLLFFFVSLLLTAALQIGYRQLSGKAVSGVRSPAAWRTIPYILLIHYVR
jgi:Flp pilus assembly protein protease CpaA